MHDNVRKWFYQEGGVDIIDNEEVCNEYSLIPDMKINSLGKLYMVDKDEIKKPTEVKVDSLALTFAKPVVRKLEYGNGRRITIVNIYRLIINI